MAGKRTPNPSQQAQEYQIDCEELDKTIGVWPFKDKAKEESNA